MENLGKHLQGGLAFTENDVVSHATDVFRPIAQEVSMKSSNVVYVRPISSSQEGPWEFKIMQRGNQYMQTNQMRLYLRCKVTDSNNAKITEADGVGVCNLLGNSLIQTIEVEIGGKAIPELQNTHANYKAYLETLLSYNEDARKGHLQASLFHLDDADQFDDVKYGTGRREVVAVEAVAAKAAEGDKPAVQAVAAVTGVPGDPNSGNEGYLRRRELVQDSRLFECIVPLHCDFLNCDRLLPPGIDLTVKLTRASDAFILMHPTSATGKKFKLHIEDMRLTVPYISVADSIIAEHKRRITTEPILLPIKKTEIITHTFGAGNTNLNITNQFHNRTPKTLIIGMLATESYNGSTKTNPYNFKHFNVDSVNIVHNGQCIPTEPYRPDWTNELIAREYRGFLDNIGVGTDNIGNCITPIQYSGGTTLFAFDLTPDRCNGYHWHKREEGGSVDIDLRFKQPIPAGGVTVMLFAVYDALVAIDANSQVGVAI
jgi:hypothetical protein